MASKIFYVAVWLRSHYFRITPWLLEKILRYLCGCEISAKMKVGRGLRLLHNGLGCVIHQGTTIGNNVEIHQNVTLGGRNGSGLPIIMDNVMIGAGAVVLGDIVIGKNSQIGANAVVIKDVPERSIVVGVPGKVIKTI